MTARQHTHATSNNSIPRTSRTGLEAVTLQRDTLHRPTAQHINNRNSAITPVDQIIIKTAGVRKKSSDHISRMQTDNLVQLPANLQEPVLLLPPKGKHITQGADL